MSDTNETDQTTDATEPEAPAAPQVGDTYAPTGQPVDGVQISTDTGVVLVLVGGAWRPFGG